MNEEVTQKANSYARSYAKHASSPKSLKWQSYRAAALRYRQIVADLNLTGKSILDVGCGFGDIIPYIFAQTKDFTYKGVDMLEQFVVEATRRYAGFEFVQLDYLANPLDEEFDIIMCSGALNSNYADNLAYRKQAIKTFFDHAREAVVFNMAGSHPQPANRDDYIVHYVDSQEILDYCLSLSRKVIFKQHYQTKDFTIVIFK